MANQQRHKSSQMLSVHHIVGRGIQKMRHQPKRKASLSVTHLNTHIYIPLVFSWLYFQALLCIHTARTEINHEVKHIDFPSRVLKITWRTLSCNQGEQRDKNRRIRDTFFAMKSSQEPIIAIPVMKRRPRLSCSPQHTPPC